MRFFKYLIFIILTLTSINSFADTEYSVDLINWTTSGSTACNYFVGRNNEYGSKIISTQFSSPNLCFFFNSSSVQIGSSNLTIREKTDSCKVGQSAYSGSITVQNWKDEAELDDLSRAAAAKFAGSKVCHNSCVYNFDYLGGSDGDLVNGPIIFKGSYSSTTQSCTSPTQGPTDTINGTGKPTEPDQCKNSSGSDSYCDKPPGKSCPSGYKEGMFNNKQICVKNSPDSDPTKPNPNDPNNSGDGKGNCNGTNNCNTTDFDDSKIVSAINESKNSILSSISNAVASLSSALSSGFNSVASAVNATTAAVNSLKSSVDATTNAVNANGDKVKTAVDANTAATNSVKNSVDANTAATNSVKNSLDTNTTAVNANGDKVKTAVDANTTAVNANGDKVKTAIDENTTAVNTNGKNIKDAVDSGTAATKQNGEKLEGIKGSIDEGNGFLKTIKDFLTDSSLPPKEGGNLNSKSFEIPEVNNTFQWSAQCPVPITENISIIGYSWQFNFSFDSYCTVLSRLSSYFVFSSFLAAAFIIAGVRSA